MPPIASKPLILYISTPDAALGALLAQEDQNNKEQAIYYIGRTLVSYETKYSIIEKACLAVVFCISEIAPLHASS